MKKARTIWLDDTEYKKLKEKAHELFEGKGFVEKFIREIISNQIIILKGSGKFKITTDL